MLVRVSTTTKDFGEPKSRSSAHFEGSCSDNFMWIDFRRGPAYPLNAHDLGHKRSLDCPLPSTPHKARNGELSITCRNRHCPKCQRLERERWLEKREDELLPVPYFHLVFTVPHQLNPLFLTDPKTLYSLLFRSTADTLLEIAEDRKHLGAKIGFLAILHSWGSNLEFHPTCM